jgi:hypothetical protein
MFTVGMNGIIGIINKKNPIIIGARIIVRQIL